MLRLSTLPSRVISIFVLALTSVLLLSARAETVYGIWRPFSIHILGLAIKSRCNHGSIVNQIYCREV